MMFRPRILMCRNSLQRIYQVSTNFYSKRSDSKLLDAYKVVKSRRELDSVESDPLDSTPNWELLTPNGYRFFLPGSVGPAWHDATSLAQLGNISMWTTPEEKVSKEISNSFKFSAQSCPGLLRNERQRETGMSYQYCTIQIRFVIETTHMHVTPPINPGVTELFTGVDFSEADLTIISLKCKLSLEEDELGNEDVIKTFVLAAQEICARLRMAGYWADFINPFSGRPCLNPGSQPDLYETDPRFRCLDFKVVQKGSCKIIKTEKRERSFIGSLFTTAPASISVLNEVFNTYD